MRRAVPSISEQVDDLKQRLQREPAGRKKARLQMLYRLATGQAATRHAVAHLLGVSRNTVGRWRTTYETGGVAALLDLYVPTGTQPSLAPEVLTGSAQALRTPTGFGSYEELRQWVEQTYQVHVKYKTRSTMPSRPAAVSIA